MPKMKSHSGSKKRVRRTGSGQLTMRRSRRNHLLQQKSARQKRLDRTLVISPREHKKFEALLPSL